MNTADEQATETTYTDTLRENLKEMEMSPSTPSLRECIEVSVGNYFQHLDGQGAADVYDMVLSEVEAPLLEVVMKYTRHNQTKASQVLGLNRGTLRKKLKRYGLL